MTYTKLRNRITPLIQQISPEAALLLPLRLFIGLGWLRAGLEKLLYYDVVSASWLKTFFAEQLSGGHVVFPLYATLIETVFVPYASVISVLVVVIQLSIGLAIIMGMFTQLALLWGILLNISFVLAGVPNPSAFYLLIQAALFTANAGATLGLDAYLSKRVSLSVLCAQPDLQLTHSRADRRALLWLAILFACIGLSALPFVRDFSPQALEDSAMILMICGLMMASNFLLAFLRLPPVPDLVTVPSVAAPSQRLLSQHSVNQRSVSQSLASRGKLTSDTANPMSDLPLEVIKAGQGVTVHADYGAGD